MTKTQLAKMYAKGYRYQLNIFKTGSVIPLLCVKKLMEIGPLMRTQYKDYHVQGLTIFPDGTLSPGPVPMLGVRRDTD